MVRFKVKGKRRCLTGLHERFCQSLVHTRDSAPSPLVKALSQKPRGRQAKMYPLRMNYCRVELAYG